MRESFYCLQFLPDLCLTASSWAAWVQAIGSFIAILVAFVVLFIQRKHEIQDRAEQRKREVEREMQIRWEKARLLVMTRHSDLKYMRKLVNGLQGLVKVEGSSVIKAFQERLEAADSAPLDRLESDCELALSFRSDLADGYLTMVAQLRLLYDRIDRLRGKSASEIIAGKPRFIASLDPAERALTLVEATFESVRKKGIPRTVYLGADMEPPH